VKRLLVCLFFCLFIIGGNGDCSSLRMEDPNSLYFLTNTGEQLHRCKVPDMVILDDKLPDRIVELTKNAVEYWNSIGTKPIFFFAGTSPFAIDLVSNSKVITIFDMPEVLREIKDDEYNLAFTHLQGLADGCISVTNIFLDLTKLNDMSDVKVETAIRHELGHALGFDHSERSVDLMYKSINSRLMKNKDLSGWEIKAFNRFYSEVGKDK